VFKYLVFSISLFHALLIERKKFGSIGWNNYKKLDFINEDLGVTISQVFIMLGE